MAAPLSGIRVLDLSTVVAGPYGSDILASLGAEVIRVVPKPGKAPAPRGNGPVSDADGFVHAFHRSKKSVALNLKDAGGKADFLRLVEGADVVYDNFRPGVTARLGIDHRALERVNPRIICCSISGYGSEGPWAEVGAYDVTVQALSGGMSITGSNDAARMPCRWGVPIGDITGAFYAVIGVLAALEDRARTGKGQAVEISLLDGQLALNTYRVPQAFGAGVEFGVPEPRRGGAGTVPYGPFRCGDGAWIVIGVASKFWQAFCAATGLDGLSDDPRFATLELRQKNQAALEPLIEARLLADTAEAWQARLIEAKVPVARVNTIAEAFDHPQARARGMAVELPGTGGVVTAGSPIRFAGEAPVAATAPIADGADTDDLLNQARSLQPDPTVVPDPEIAALAPRPGPLSGVMVLELCGDEPSGTFGTQILADLGATVVKVERPGLGGIPPDPADLPITPALAYTFGLNRNKRSACLDLKSPAGRAAFLSLTARAAVVYDNHKPGVMARLGLSPEDLRAANPRIIACSVSGFGQTGPWSSLPAYDATIQALGGGMSLTGTGDPDSLPVRCGNPVGGIAGAFYAVIGILAALRRARTEGRPATLDIALFDAQLATLCYRVAPALSGRTYPAVQRRGGSGALPYGPFRCKGGRWFVLGITPQFWPAAAGLLGHPEWAEDPRFVTEADRQANEVELNALVERAMAAATPEEWQERFVAAGIPGAAVRTIREAYDHPHVAPRNMLRTFGDPVGSRLRVAGDPIRLSGHADAPFAPVPGLGADTKALLTALADLPPGVVAELRATGAAWWPEAGVCHARPSVV
ncbi:hypothetical protein HKCCE2091_05800 [Rhodobacterales bacterium HKCCE2091]|nr:hypothetical protein [Rhodobacterales bacterium HKCCE2091]